MTSEKVAELIGLRVSINILFFGVVPGYTGILPVPSSGKVSFFVCSICCVLMSARV